MANKAGVFNLSRNRGARVGPPGLQLTNDSADPTDGGLASGRLAITNNALRLYGGTSWTTILQASGTGVDLEMNGHSIIGNTTAGGNLILSSTSNATKGYIGIADGEEGIKIGGTADRATTVGTNVISIFDGTAPAGTLANGVSLYSAAGELWAMDAAGNATLLSPHTKDGDYIISSYSAKKKKTFILHLEKLATTLIRENKKLAKFVEWK